MATFISLVNFTQQGIRDFKDPPDRASKFKSMAEKIVVKIRTSIGPWEFMMLYSS
jgi:uncharacterized protein with GYD domain